MANKIIENLITKQIACAYLIYKNDSIANGSSDIMSFEEYAELFALNLKHNLNDIMVICSEVDKKCKEEKKQAKIDKKRGAK